MRPEVLYPLFAPVRSLPGVGAQLETTLTRLAGSRVLDLLWHLPVTIVERRRLASLADAGAGPVILSLRIDEHEAPRSPRHPYRVWCSDDSGNTTALVFFHARPDYLQRVLPPGEVRLVSGVLDRYGETAQITHPDYIVGADEADSIPQIETIYPLATGLSGKVLRRLVGAALQRAPALDEWLDPALVRQRGWPHWRDALALLHAPADATVLEPTSLPRCRLAYDELLANQLALAVMRGHLKRQPGRALRGDGRLRRRLLASLPFPLTAAQTAAAAEIDTDMQAPTRMLRLLQGDVGSGKTVVALLAMLAAVETGAQAVLMAPTELLARQHGETLGRFAKSLGLTAAVLTGREKGAPRERLLTALAEGTINIVVGTHALFQESVAFADLALVVIDEQHRFGVHQRLSLAGKGAAADVLVMTATPIPRTLMLAAYGDLDVSRLEEKPPGRTPIVTRAIPLDRLEEVVAAVGRSLARGDRVYWVCPLVSVSETLDVAAAEERFATLHESFGDRVGLLHGRMSAAEKDKTMAAFVAGRIAVLVATTVIEVGVDVPEATVMVIEHAERFGLAQLHQLRGRVGRGEGQSSCLLLYAPPLTATAHARLAILRETDDGFRIAEEDLRLRGAGELLGVRQSGLPTFRVADLAAHADLLPIARDDVQLILGRDPDLESPRGRALRTLLYLFERDAAVGYLRSG
ncbi:ATP-dependent DNA helicase RecG [Defluviicoccus vanus]|uniref:Probable DNA 3'-5' helicase RecG n=1 Tax=Defluviicoccus vanus TaxID=111831 RepID=A0A7H1MZ46_9PROT|nr:ATP-dependent DNA helicase RecG [Defluviicoccus vanus]QNT68732.1 ATP-dependent DNA helicase RecG [Defluviicoccus vanus]